MWPAATGWVYVRNPRVLTQGEGGTVFSHWLLRTRSFLCLPLVVRGRPLRAPRAQRRTYPETEVASGSEQLVQVLPKTPLQTRTTSQEMLSGHQQTPGGPQHDSIGVQNSKRPRGGVSRSMEPTHGQGRQGQENFSWPRVLDGSGPGGPWPGGSAWQPG